tara:strand:+ start:337 stop:600 length:264 start_codon:yes stop_codon:yes gene_type:complete
MDDWEMILYHCETLKGAVDSNQENMQHLKKINPYDFIDESTKTIYWNKFSNNIEDIVAFGGPGFPEHSKFSILVWAEAGHNPFENNF